MRNTAYADGRLAAQAAYAKMRGLDHDADLAALDDARDTYKDWAEDVSQAWAWARVPHGVVIFKRACTWMKTFEG